MITPVLPASVQNNGSVATAAGYGRKKHCSSNQPAAIVSGSQLPRQRRRFPGLLLLLIIITTIIMIIIIIITITISGPPRHPLSGACGTAERGARWQARLGDALRAPRSKSRKRRTGSAHRGALRTIRVYVYMICRCVIHVLFHGGSF